MERTPNAIRSLQVTLVLFIIPAISMAQIGIDETIAYLNSKLLPEYELASKKNQLEVKGFRNGTQVKRDHVFINDLDLETLAFIKEENAVRVKCFDNKNDCVERELFVDKAKSYRGRLVFELKDGQDPEPIIKGMRHLLKLVQDGKKYQNQNPFD
jgi:hypothetical protein